MAALCVASPGSDCAFPRQRIPRTSRTGMDDGTHSSRRCRDGWEAGGIYGNANWRYLMHTAINTEDKAGKPTPRLPLSQSDPAYLRASALVAKLLDLIASTSQFYGAPSPFCDPTVDRPITYTPTTDDLASVRVEAAASAPTARTSTQGAHAACADRYGVMADIDFDDTKGIQSRGKKAKQAAKKAQQAKWMESDNEGEGGAAGEENGEGGGGREDGSAAGGAGGGDDNNGGEDNDDDWFGGGGKKSKKNKKSKKAEEEEKRKQEEEERKKKEEEDAAAAGGGNALNWADDTNAANAEDDWTAGFTTKKDKKKKGKKGLDESIPAVPDPPPSTFQDVSLDDGGPNLDFSFSSGKDTKSKDTSSGFGTWAKTWDFNSLGGTTTDSKKDEKAAKTDKEAKDTSNEFGDNNPWNFGNKSKASKKKTTMSTGFDFGDFGNVDEANEFDLDADIAGGDTKATDNAWGFSTVNKKDDKKKKGAKEESAIIEPEAKEEDAWGPWGAKTTTTKKKSKKGAVEEEIPPPPPAPVAPVPDTPVEDEWSSFNFGGAKKDKKKPKKGALDDKASETKEDTAEADIGATGFDWGMGTTTKKDKDKDKKTKKGLISEVKEEPIDTLDTPAAEKKVEDEDDLMNGAWGTSTKKKDKKTGKKGSTEEPVSTFDFSPAAETKTTTSDPPEDTWGFSSGKKDKKSKKDTKVEEIPPPPVLESEPTAEENDIWDFGKKDKKSGKKGKVTSPEPSIPDPEPGKIDEVPETDTWSSWGMSKTDKKKKDSTVKRKTVTETLIPDSEPVKEEEKVEDAFDWGLSTKDKKKKEKEAKKKGIIEPIVADLDLEPESEPEPEPEETSWNTWGTTTKKDKKSTATKDSKKKGILDTVELTPKEKEKDKIEDDIWGSWGKKEKTGKKGKKDELPPPAPTPPAQGLTPEPGPVDMPDIDDFGGDAWVGLSKQTTKSSSTTKKGLLSKTASTKSKKDDSKLKSKDADLDLDDLATGPQEEKGDKKAKEETPAKAVRSIWGSMATTSTSKPKFAKEKEEKAKKDAEEKARIEAEEAEAAEAARIKEEEEAAAAAKKLSKTSKTTSKLSKSTIKSADKTDEKDKKTSAFDDHPLIDILDEPTPKEDKTKSSKLKKSTTSKTAEKEEEKEEEKKGDDYFGFWGSGGSTSKKTAGTKWSDAKKEITKQGLTNESDALANLDFLNNDDKPAASKSAKTAMSTSATKSKTTIGTSSVAARIKALEGSKEEAGKKSKTSDASWLTKEPALEPKEEQKASLAASSSKAKSNLLSTSASKSTSKSKKDSSPVTEEKKSKDSVPGSFPSGFGDDDDYPGFNDFPTSPEKVTTTKKSSKLADSKKADKKSTTTKTKTKDLAAVDDMDLLVEAPEPPKLPTPPPEEKKPAKKERARVERSGTGASWGFWGAAAPAPKKATVTKSKDDGTVSPEPSTDKEKKKSAKEKSPPAGPIRSKSTKTPKEKDRDDRREAEKSSKSSASDEKDAKSSKKAAERPKASRGMSFSNFMMGGPPPSAMRPKTATRRSSTAGSRSSSRRQSVSGDGLMSPPPDDDDKPEVTGKAAKLMGFGGSGKVKSVKGKGKATVPDPYPIDDDDMVMINDPGDSPINNAFGSSSKAPAKDRDKSKSKTSKSKREIKSSHTKNISQDDDVVMVDRDAEREPMVTSGPDDLAFVDHPPSLKRSNTTGMTKRATGLFGSFFGGAAIRKEGERPRSTYVTDAEDGGLPIRTRQKSATSGSKRRSAKDIDGEGFTTDVDAEAARRAERRAKREAKEAKIREAEEADRADREARRKARREREKADIEARRQEENERKRKEDEAEEARQEEKRARRAEREKRTKDVDDEGIGMSVDAAARKEERRRLREKLEAEAGARDEKRRSFYDTGDDDRRRWKDDKPSKSKDKERSSRSKRQSTALMDEYHESRSGNRKKAGPGENENNKASSWVNSLADETPDPPPVEGTILDGGNEKPRAVAGAVGGSFKERDKDSKRHSRRFDDDPAEEKEHRSSRRKEKRQSTILERESGNVKSTSGASGEHGRRSRRDTLKGNEDYDLYATEKFDGGRPGLARAESKRNSFFGKLF